jgi:hypothetical protein
MREKWLWKFGLDFGFFAFCEVFANGCLCGHQKAFGEREREMGSAMRYFCLLL